MFSIFKKTKVKKTRQIESILPGQPQNTVNNIHMITQDVGNGLVGDMRKYLSHQIQDPFVGGYAGDSNGSGLTQLLEPYYAPEKLNSLVNTNAMLKQCVTSTVVNVAGNGLYLHYKGPDQEKQDESVLQKKETFLDILTRPNPDTDGESFFRDITEDIVRLGYAYIEVTRTSTGDIGYLYHVPACTVRKSKVDDEAVAIDEYVVRNGKVKKVEGYKKRFRRYGMKAGARLNTVYFKEFKDPRTIDKRTGKVDPSCPVEFRASEILEISKYEPNHIYALPSWINQLPAILGSRLAEEVNLSFFESNAIPAMLLMVSGGGLTPESIDNLQRKFNQLQGKESVQKILIVEATGDEQAAQIGGTIPPPRIEAKTMVHERQSDALFKDYNEDNNKSIQCNFRIPDVILGKTHNINRATAYASIVVAESQVFNPIRRMIEAKINSVFLVDSKGLPDKHWEFKFKPTKLLNEETVFNSIDRGIKSGVATPKDVANILRDNFNVDIPTENKEWVDDIPALALPKALQTAFEKLAATGKVINMNLSDTDLMQLTVAEGSTGMPQFGTVLTDSGDIIYEPGKDKPVEVVDTTNQAASTTSKGKRKKNK